GERAAFEVVQAEAGSELAVVVLDPPSDLGQAYQFGDGGVCGEGGQPVVGGFFGFGWPFGQQPAFWQGAAGAAGDVAVGGPGPDGQEAAGHGGGRGCLGRLGGLAPGDGLDLAGAGGGGPGQVRRAGAGGGDRAAAARGPRPRLLGTQ